MDEQEQARAYATADFSEPHDQFIGYFQQHTDLTPDSFSGLVLDLGCGPADITIRFAKAYPNTLIHGVDGAEAMLQFGYEAINKADLSHRIELYQGLIQSAELPLQNYDVIISNSLLHHVHEPEYFWSAIRRYQHQTTNIFVMDLLRPTSINEVDKLVDQYAADEPEILQRDFRNSLIAAFTVDEVQQQLDVADLPLHVQQVSDRHLIVYG